MAKAALQTHMGQLILTPKGTQKGPVFGVSGAIDLLGSKDVMLVVARDGIEPPTPAFPGLLTDKNKSFVVSKRY